MFLFNFFITLFALPVLAQTATPAQPSVFEALMPFIVLMVVMYFLMIRPQVKKSKEHQKFVTELKRGDEVVTTGGILGRIEGLTEAVVTLEVADGVRIKILRSQVVSSTKSSLEAKK
ncbi:MAG: preprotein translocase subunit YajC [Bdellovibrionota bacterium]